MFKQKNWAEEVICFTFFFNCFLFLAWGFFAIFYKYSCLPKVLEVYVCVITFIGLWFLKSMLLFLDFIN